MADCATANGTAAYRDRFAARYAPGNFRQLRGSWLSSIGIGTYLGNHDAQTDESYAEAIAAALVGGCNFIDTAINYRFQRSERVIGATLNRMFSSGELQRDAVGVATKGGYLPFDGEPPADPSRWFRDTFVATGVATAADLVAGCHCMTPAYLRHQLAASLRNLRLHCVDVYYLHNPETQLEQVDRDEFRRRVRTAFAVLEEAADAGQIRSYGMATWNGFRQPPSARDHLSLAEIVGLAREVGGDDHHFAAIQLPYNLAMPEAYTRQNQGIGDEMTSCIEAARRLGVAVVCSASILQGRLSRRLPQEIERDFPGLSSDAQRALQFVRSTPGVTTALVGMKTAAHVLENLETARVAPLSAEQFGALFERT